jgi:eukaryotic-like serine/threonine-protein kinase
MKWVLVQELEKGRVSFCPVGRWLTMGRSGRKSDIVCKDQHVSRAHCKVRGRPDGGLDVEDMSQFGTAVNGTPVPGTAKAKARQILTLGTSYDLRVIGLLDADSSTAELDEPEPPQRLGAHIILLSEVGRGGMGVVYDSWDEQRQQRCAVKWLREGGKADAEHIGRFHQEAELQGRMGDYPGIVKIYDLGVVLGSGELFCVMEFVDGESLLQKMKHGLERAEAVRIVARAARATAYAHAQGVLHRDIKPGNIMITKQGQVRLTDFGIARALDAGGGRTMTGIMLGTPGYMAPEQIRDAKSVGPAADVYALGATLYASLTKKLPMKGKNVVEALRAIMNGEEVLSPRHYVPDLDPVLEAACLRSLDFDPEKRWSNPELLATELERWLKHHSPEPEVRLSGPA